MKDYWYPKKTVTCVCTDETSICHPFITTEGIGDEHGRFCGFVAGHRVKQAFKPTIYFPEFGESTYTGIFKTFEVKL